MLRILRAFAWLRWRMFVNSLERTGARDTLERFSLAIEKLGPIMAGVLMVPSALALAVTGAAAGYALAQGEGASFLFSATRIILFAVLVLCVVGPLALPAADRTNPVRMLLLPIPRATMYVAQAGTALADPWVLLATPFLLCLPLGLIAGGALLAALLALAGGLLFLLVATGLTSLVTSLMHLALRDRRRGEMLALLLILVLPAIGIAPGLIMGERSAKQRSEPSTAAPPGTAPPWLAESVRRARAALPSELYVDGATSASSGAPARAGAPVAGLAAIAVLFHGLGFLLFGRILDSPGTTGARRATAGSSWKGAFFGLSPGTSAVALTHLRLGLRTPRGRSTMLSPLIMLGVLLAVAVSQGGLRFGDMDIESGLSLAVFATFVSLVAILPIAMNQFAVDRAGFTLAMLLPLSEREYLDGKAIGNALIMTPALVLSIVGPMLALPGGSLALWIALALSVVCTYLLVAPAAAVFSALLPRAVDLNSIGRGSNAHGLAGLLGLLAFAAAAAPCVLIVAAAVRLLHNPAIAPVLLVGWLLVTVALNRALFIVARRIFAERRENLGFVAFQRT